MKSILITLLLLLPYSMLCAAESKPEAAPCTILFVRHAQTTGNAAGNYGGNNHTTFSEKGLEQIEELTEKLGEYPIDTVLVSPKLSARYTIVTYLKKHGMKAEIWPELTECCSEEDREAPASKELPPGRQITVENHLQSLFILRNMSADRELKPLTYRDGIGVIETAHSLITKRYAGSGKTVLIVGHYHSGSRIIEMLQGFPPTGMYQLKNGRISILKEQEDGTFNLTMLNGEEIKQE